MMRILAEAQDHDEGWLHQQVRALTQGPGSNQGGSSSREDAQADWEATCAGAWPSSSDKGGPSGGERHPVRLLTGKQKGKSVVTGGKATACHGRGHGEGDAAWRASERKVAVGLKKKKKKKKNYAHNYVYVYIYVGMSIGLRPTWREDPTAGRGESGAGRAAS
ncbi:hypothetical protein FKM82_027723 [Ascaphus truei]